MYTRLLKQCIPLAHDAEVQLVAATAVQAVEAVAAVDVAEVHSPTADIPAWLEGMLEGG